MRRSRVIALMLLFVVPSASFLAQQKTNVVISGVVSDSATGTPLENVNIFLSFTTIGASTAPDGNFRLSNVPFGAFDLVFSRIGYERVVINIRVIAPETLQCNIRLKPQILQVQEIKIVTESPQEWRENLERFVKAFIGTAGNADQCSILNPEVIDFRFDDHTDTLIAATDSVLYIENRALGYRLSIILKTFVWNVRRDCGRYFIYPRFKELLPCDAKELSRWRENRLQSFAGSLRHFLRALYARTIEDEKFSISSGLLKYLVLGFGHRLAPDELAVENGTPFKTLRFPESLRIEYWGKEGWFAKDRISVSFMTLTQAFALIDRRGNLLNPLSLEVAGAWSLDRVAKLLPTDEEP
jgi:hypothetical protein